MAVGTKFLDPDTQAAIAAQGGEPVKETPEATEPVEKPKEAVNEEPAAEPVAEQQTPVEGETPEPEGASEDKDASADTDMTKIDLNDQESLDKQIADAGFSNEDLGKELAENDGKFKEETIKALKEKFPADAVDKAVDTFQKQYAEKIAELPEPKAKIVEMNNFIYGELAGGDVVKGQENLKVLSTWARENLDAETLGVINAKLSSGNKIVVKEGLQAAVSAWKKGQEKPMMTGDAPAAQKTEEAPTIEPLGKDEFIQITMTKKYKEDPDYAKLIDDRRRATIAKGGFSTPEYHATYRPARR
jgi:hypothetical protein